MENNKKLDDFSNATYLVEPNCCVKLLSVQKNDADKEKYDKNDWRCGFCDCKGALDFVYYKKSFKFQTYTGKFLENEEFEEETKSMHSSKIKDICESADKLIITTRNTIYTFEIIKKVPEENTQAYFDYLVSQS